MKYKVKVTFKYSDVVHVEAADKEEAIVLALSECEEEYECLYDAEATEEE